MQEEKELGEVLELMVEKMLEMERQIEVLNEKQNKEENNEVPKSGRTDEGKQITIEGL